MKKKKQNTQFGRSMLEIITVIAIIAILLITGLWGMRTIVDDNRAENLQKQILSMVKQRQLNMPAIHNKSAQHTENGPYGVELTIENGITGENNDYFWVSAHFINDVICEKIATFDIQGNHPVKVDKDCPHATLYFLKYPNSDGRGSGNDSTPITPTPVTPPDTPSPGDGGSDCSEFSYAVSHACECSPNTCACSTYAKANPAECGGDDSCSGCSCASYALSHACECNPNTCACSTYATNHVCECSPNTCACSTYATNHACECSPNTCACSTYANAHACECKPNTCSCDTYASAHVCECNKNTCACSTYADSHACECSPNTCACSTYATTHACECNPNTCACSTYADSHLCECNPDCSCPDYVKAHPCECCADNELCDIDNKCVPCPTERDSFVWMSKQIAANMCTNRCESVTVANTYNSSKRGYYNKCTYDCRNKPLFGHFITNSEPDNCIRCPAPMETITMPPSEAGTCDQRVITYGVGAGKCPNAKGTYDSGNNRYLCTGICPPNTPQFNGEECEPCPDETPYWDGTTCTTCPNERPVWNGTTCTACPAITPIWNGTECTPCPAETPYWNGTVCAPCPSDKPVWNGSTCTQCPSETAPIWNGTECVPCDEATPYWDGTRCTGCPANALIGANNRCVAQPKCGDFAYYTSGTCNGRTETLGGRQVCYGYCDGDAYDSTSCSGPCCQAMLDAGFKTEGTFGYFRVQGNTVKFLNGNMSVSKNLYMPSCNLETEKGLWIKDGVTVTVNNVNAVANGGWDGLQVDGTLIANNVIGRHGQMPNGGSCIHDCDGLVVNSGTLTANSVYGEAGISGKYGIMLVGNDAHPAHLISNTNVIGISARYTGISTNGSESSITAKHGYIYGLGKQQGISHHGLALMNAQINPSLLSSTPFCNARIVPGPDGKGWTYKTETQGNICTFDSNQFCPGEIIGIGEEYGINHRSAMIADLSIRAKASNKGYDNNSGFYSDGGTMTSFLCAEGGYDAMEIYKDQWSSLGFNIGKGWAYGASRLDIRICDMPVPNMECAGNGKIHRGVQGFNCKASKTPGPGCVFVDNY